MKQSFKKLGNVALAVAFLTCSSVFADSFSIGNLVVAVEGAGSTGGTYSDNQAAPLSLFQYTTSGTFVNSLVLPQTNSGSNYAVSGEYGSSSEGTLQLSGNGAYLTIMGYGINAAQFNANPGAYSPSSTNKALGQSGSMTNQSSYTPVPRVAALIDANGNVNSSTAVYNVFNANNPRSAYTQNGQTIYISGQGTSGDNTGGVFVTSLGSNSGTSITGNNAGSGASQDTREVQIYNGQLYVSVDSKAGATNRDFVGTLGSQGNPPTSVANGGNGPTMLPGYGNSGGTGRIAITSATTNGINAAGQTINLSPENYFFANPDTLYVADSGDPKNTSATNVSGGTSLGDGGLQKWILVDGTWQLQYTLSAGLGLVPNSDSDGTSGLYGLTGEVIGNEVELFATNFTLGDTDQTYLYEITDGLYSTSGAGESFTELAAAPADSNFKGVSFAPIPEPGTYALLGLGLSALGIIRGRKLFKS